jgi:hypothetical protein
MSVSRRIDVKIIALEMKKVTPLKGKSSEKQAIFFTVIECMTCRNFFFSVLSAEKER